MEATHHDTPEGARYGTLTQRAVEFVLAHEHGVPEEALVAHVFGSDSSPTLWRGLLRSVLADEERIELGADGVWRAPRPAVAEDFPADFVVLDVETTGLKPRHHRITEIAIISVNANGENLAWSTLVNPERGIPRQVSRLTGIDNQMVAGAPRFASVAQTVLELIGDRLIVGHNVDFDIGFLNAELARCGRPKLVNQSLDTLALADAMLTGLRRLALLDVSRHLGVEQSRAHRAMADAEATLGVLARLRAMALERGDGSLETLASLAAARRTRRPKQRKVSRGRSVLDASHLEGIPQEPGVYIMRDVDERVIYIGKAKNLRKRVSSYYSQPLGYTRKMDGLLESIAAIDVEVTGSELEALVLESQLIRRYRPRFNSQQRNAEQYVYIRVDTTNPWPTVTLARDRGDDEARYFGPFKSARHARDAVRLINDVLPLRTCRRSFRDSRSFGSPCIELSLKRCLGPCVGAADPDEYKGIVADVLAFLDGDKERLLPVLHERLERAARMQDFERASKLRDQIRRLDRITLEQAHIDIVAKAGHLLLVLPGRDPGCRQVWHLYRGVRWASFDIEPADALDDVAARLRRSRERAEAMGESVVMTHHTVDEASITSRWVRKYGDAEAVIHWGTEQDPREIAAQVLVATPLDPDELDAEELEGEAL
ncbi:MAG TPA: exonuclease domain-containing protein [Thermomicrobiales bacterium]|nr:exonuclease domain-containing protein [Thermomicrobiales bacterium]